MEASAAERAWAGTSTTPTCSSAPSASSVPATTRTWCSVDSRARRGREAKLERAARVADVGCGHGASTIILAKAFPKSTFVGFDYHRAVDRARHASARDEAGVARPRALRGGLAPKTFRAGTTWSRSSIACTTWATPSAPPRTCASRSSRDGTWLLVEPFAGDRVEDNLNPARAALLLALDARSARPASLSQEVGAALGAQAGEARMREVMKKAGFRHFRRATETPFNLIFEIRP